MNRPQGSRRTKAPIRRNVMQQLNRALDLEELVVLPKPAAYHTTAVGMAQSSQLQLLTSRPITRASRSIQSLKSIMANFIALNIEAVPSQVLMQYNWDQIEVIWDEIVKKMYDSIEVFAKFTMAFPQDMKARKVIHSSLDTLPGLIGRINAVAMMSISYRKQLAMCSLPPCALHLDLSHVPVAQDILLQLGAVPGLSVLKVSDTGLTNEMINHWARSESATGFSQLKLLDIRKNSRTLHNLQRALTTLVHFKVLQVIRCDKLQVDIFDSAFEYTAERQERWHRISDESNALIEVITHLGSKADRRPLSEAIEDMFVDVQSSHCRLLSKESTDNTASMLRIGERKRKKQKQLLTEGGDLWKHGF